MALHIPKLREGSYFPSLLEPRRRSEKALLAVIQQAYIEGVSTRRVDDLIKALGCDGISSSQVSRICEQLDEVVESFLGRPLDGGPYPYVWLDGLTQKVREGGRIVNVCVVVATGVNAEGQREILGMDVGASEDGGPVLPSRRRHGRCGSQQLPQQRYFLVRTRTVLARSTTGQCPFAVPYGRPGQSPPGPGVRFPQFRNAGSGHSVTPRSLFLPKSDHILTNPSD